MTPLEYITAMQGITILINLLRGLNISPDEEVTQEQLDKANAEMNTAVANWDNG